MQNEDTSFTKQNYFSRRVKKCIHSGLRNGSRGTMPKLLSDFKWKQFRLDTKTVPFLNLKSCRSF